MNKMVRTRFAPSPTGCLHAGGLRTALFNYLYAKKHNGQFILRIEDTDRERFVDGAEAYIINSLKWAGIVPDDGVNEDGTAKYRQSEREYYSYAKTLIDKGFAYYAFDTKEELDEVRKEFLKSGVRNFAYNFLTRSRMKNSFTLSEKEINEKIESGEKYVIRFNIPENIYIEFNDIIRGHVKINSKDLDDKILIKSDGMVAYHLANVVDDHLMKITHVIRAEEWLPSTPLHILLYDAFGWDKPEFCHLPLVLGPDGKKLSKRHASKYGFPIFPIDWDYVQDGNPAHASGFREAGFDADSLLNFLSLLGWNPGNNKEIMDMKELISLFDLDRVNKAGAIFDIEKLKSFNATYLRNKSSDFLFSCMVPNFKLNKCGTFLMPYSIKNNKKITDIAKDRAIFSKDLYGYVSYFYEPLILKDGVTLKNPKEFKEVMEAFIDLWDTRGSKMEFKADQIMFDLEEFCKVLGFKIGKIMPDLRLALTGGIPGPHLDETMEILGFSESKNRIKALILQMEKVPG